MAKASQEALEKPCNALLFPYLDNMNILADFSSLKALSVAGPFPWRLASGKKTIELRSWPSSYRGIALIHASSGSGFEHLFEGFGLSRKDCPKFAIVGAARIVNCVRYDSREKWESDLLKHCWQGDETYLEVVAQYGKPPFGHLFEDAIAFPEPVLDVPGSFNYWQPRNDRQVAGFKKAIALLKSIGYLS
jgi:hypothetical protein